MFQGEINGVGFYFGIQTNVSRRNPPIYETQGTGKGLIFSRWDTNDLTNVRIGKGSWSEHGCEDGPFVSVRKNYMWTTHVYQLKIAFTDSDDKGDWYGVWIRDLDENTEDFLGSIRFLETEPGRVGIKDQGARARQTFTELYHKKDREAPIPTWHVSIEKIFMDDGIRPKHATLEYGEIGHTDIYFDGETRKIHFLMGPKISREHGSGQLF